MGDSKTDEGETWPLLTMLSISPEKQWQEAPGRANYTGSGWKVADVAAAISTLSSESPRSDFIWITLGTNDLLAMPAEATIKADMASILDAIHVWSPAAQVYWAYPWRRSYTAEANTFAGYLDDVLLTRSAWAHPGPDERIWLENGDDGVTYTLDGVHYNAAGQTEAAAQWKAILGY